MRLTLLIALVFLYAPSAQADLPRAPVAGLNFHGYACTVDCSGHKAGYAWAQKKALSSEEQCSGNSNSFIEGCLAWVRAQEAANPQSPEIIAPKPPSSSQEKY